MSKCSLQIWVLACQTCRSGAGMHDVTLVNGRKIWKCFDPDCNGTMPYAVGVEILKASKRAAQQKSLAEASKAIDRDNGDGLAFFDLIAD